MGLPTTTPQEIYMYSDVMLKHLPKNALKMIEKDILFSKRPVVYTSNHHKMKSKEPITTLRIELENLAYK